MRRLLLGVTAVVMAIGIGAASTEVAEWASASPTTTTTTTTTSTTTTTTSTTTTTVPPTTTTTSPPTPRPVDVPADSYAPEPLRTIGTIEIPKLGLRAELQQGITLRNIDRGPSHWPGTAMPGQNGNVVVMGHRVTRTRPFRNIDQLVPGDEVFFEVDGVRHRYEVTGHQVVTPKQTEIVHQTAEPTGTLFACHPPGSARYRYVVNLKLA